MNWKKQKDRFHLIISGCKLREEKYACYSSSARGEITAFASSKWYSATRLEATNV